MINENETEENIEVEDTTIEQTLNKDEEIEKLTKELEEQKQKSDEYFDHLKRSMAEFDNYKKRMVKEKETMHSILTADILLDILPILDNFEQAILSESKDEKFKEGMVMIYNQLLEALKKFGLEEVEADNKTFDPDFHEAVMHIEDENYGEKQIVEVLRKGYMLGDRVIRHSLVKVAN